MDALAARRIDSPQAASLARDWQVLLDSAARVAELAGEAAGTTPASEHAGFDDLPAALHELVERQVADLLAILQPGLLTLETIAARGRHVGPAARALHREIDNARMAIARLATEPA